MNFLISRTRNAYAVLIPTVFVLLLSGCLDTRSSMQEQDEKVQMRTQVATLQRTTADTNSRFQDIEDEIRRLSGKTESLDNRLSKVDSRFEKVDAGAAGRTKDTDDKLAAYREDITRLSNEVEQLKAQMAALQDEQRRAAQQAQVAQAAQAVAAERAAKNPYAAAQEKFEQKNWKEAILDFEKYRKSNPKGKNFAAATYKIGVSFQELGLSEDAKAFYEEVISKYPKSEDAKSAAKRLKGLKKK